MGHPDPAVAAWAAGLTHRGGPGQLLVPLTPALTPTTTALEQVLTGHAGPVRSVAVTADGARAVSGGEDGTVRVWDLAAGQQQATLTGHEGAVMSVAVTADGARAVSGGEDGTVRVWDLATGQQQADAHRPRRRGGVGGGHRGRGQGGQRRRGRHGAGLGPGRRPAAGDAHRPRRRGDVGGGHRGRGQGGQRRRRRHGAGVGPGRRPAAATLTGHAGYLGVVSVAVTADGARAVSGGGDGTVRVWDLAAGQQQATLTGHDGAV